MRIVYMYIKELFKFSGWLLPVNLFGIVIVSLLEGMGILLLIPLISVTGMIPENKGIPIFKSVIGFAEGLPEDLRLVLLLVIFIFIMLSQSILQRAIRILNVKLLHEFSRELRINLFKGVLNSSWSFFIKKRKSDLLNSITSELARVVSGMNFFLQMITSVIFTSIQVLLAFWLSASITGLVLLCGAFIILCSHKFVNRAVKAGRQSSVLGKEYLAGVTDQFNGMKDIKSNTLEKSQLSWFSRHTGRMVEEQIEYVKLQTSSDLYYKVTSSIFIAIFLYFSIIKFHFHIEELMAIILIFTRLWPRFTEIQSTMQNLAATIPAFNSVQSLYTECESSRERMNPFQNHEEPYELKKGVHYRQIFYSYSNENQNYVLKNINAEIRLNEMTAIVGPSGAGKSTFIDILMGLMKPDSGEVLIDGFPLEEKNIISWRKAISYVPQDSFLFNASIRENLQLINPACSDADIWQALEFSCAADFVRSLPEGIETHIGDRGVRLSGGERQRLVLARAILKKPSILILDEATSALDSENERKIQEAIDRLKGKMTIIVIAHRLSTIKNADHVIVLDEGCMIQSGGFQELSIQKSSKFSQLLENQMEAIH
ncbi:ABC transporter ATP-binding protein [Bacillus sp. FJAT-42376]|uniref:ABC transporter ATP-binding protein n=1 Tax=Bacillus sp. FJAT-42376 TaxID=2014076 RepID=UPI000F4FAF52|nr:ABC transporter ATP-binding protein [Bacillus sp. FJAT-42376]AZB43574.1 ABC transporter ATP-binding protein [Bacillus sp. FJAT-42376]